MGEGGNAVMAVLLLLAAAAAACAVLMGPSALDVTALCTGIRSWGCGFWDGDCGVRLLPPETELICCIAADLAGLVLAQAVAGCEIVTADAAATAAAAAPDRDEEEGVYPDNRTRDDVLLVLRAPLTAVAGSDERNRSRGWGCCSDPCCCCNVEAC